MIKFTDVCKAYVRYWFVILICVVLCFGVVLAFTSDDTSYTASSKLLVEKNDTVATNEFISQAYAESVIKEMSMVISHTDFTKKMIEDIGATDPELAESLSVMTIRRNMNIVHKKDTTFFEINYVHQDESKAKIIVDSATKLAISEYGSKEGTKAKLTKVYSTEIQENAKKTSVYAVIGVLIGLVLGVVLVTFFVVFNPYVENKDLLEKETGVPVLASLEKVRGEKK